MHPFELVLGILAIIFGFLFFSRYIGYKKSMLKHGLNHDQESISMALAKQKKINEDLEKRIQVLESIVTRENYGLEQKFREL